MNEFLAFLGARGPVLLYLILGLGAAVENVFPPVPADTFVLLGSVLAARGRADSLTVFLVTWLANTTSALLVYRAGYRFGSPFFQAGLGRRLLNPHQLRRMGDFYKRWGIPAIFLARFLPGLRAMVPVFAGVTRQPVWIVAFPVLVASGIWYGLLVWIGATAGRNLPAVIQGMEGTNRILLAAGGLLLLGAGIWWLRTRKHGDEEEP